MAASPAQNVSGETPVFGGGFLGDKIEQNGSDLQSVGVDTIYDKTLAKSGSHTLFSG